MENLLYNKCILAGPNGPLGNVMTYCILLSILARANVWGAYLLENISILLMEFQLYLLSFFASNMKTIGLTGKMCLPFGKMIRLPTSFNVTTCFFLQLFSYYPLLNIGHFYETGFRIYVWKTSNYFLNLFSGGTVDPSGAQLKTILEYIAWFEGELHIITIIFLRTLHILS